MRSKMDAWNNVEEESQKDPQDRPVWASEREARSIKEQSESM